MRTLFAILLLSACCGAQVIPSVTAECATSVDGSVVGVPNPLSPPTLVPLYEFIPLPAGTYFVQEAWTDASGNTTLVGPEVQIQLTGGGGEIQETPPVSGLASTVAGRNIYIGTSSGGETLQGSVAGSAAYVQNVALVAGAAVPSTNTTLCQVIANDAAWPSGTGYEMSVTTPAGATLSGFPKQVQFLGPGNSINLGQGLPLYNGSVKYPTPIQATPYGHATQSISGGLNLGLYPITAGNASFTALVIAAPNPSPTCAFTSGGGTSPTPSCVLDTGSSNQNGIIILTTGSVSPAGTGTVTLTFANNSGGFGPDKPVCQYQASDAGLGTWSALVGFKDSVPSNTSDVFKWTNGTSPTSLSASTTYWINYQCWPK